MPSNQAEVKQAPKAIKKKNEQSVAENDSKEPSLSSAEILQFENIEKPEAVSVYKKAISSIENMEKLSAEDWEGFIENSKEIIDRFLDILENEEDSLLVLFFRDYYSFKGYLYQHAVNVCMLVLYIAKFLNYNQEQLYQLGLAALVHDIGLFKYDSLVNQNKRFSNDEYDEIKKHPIAGKNILEKISGSIRQEVLDVVIQEHERLDGSGYPYSLQEKDICEGAKLIGLIDEYESMMHVRPYRDKYKSEEVVKHITQQKDKFDYRFLKTLIDLISVFSVTTQVRLNTREVGVVVKQAHQMPLKPVVKITHNAQGQKLDSPKAVELSSNFSIYIQECFINHNKKQEKNSE